MSRVRLAAIAVAFALVPLAGRASAEDRDEKLACAAEHERAQRLRLAGHLLEARAVAVGCAREACPRIVRAECTDFVGPLDVAIPSIVLDVRDVDGELQAATIDVDGATVAPGSSGDLQLDPGEHTLRVETRDGRAIRARVVLVEGERRRRVTLVVPAARPESAAPASVAPTRASEAPRAAPATRAWWPSAVLGGVSLAGFGAFGVFGLRGYREQVELESSCAAACAPGRDVAMRRDYLAADVGLGVGVVALIGAVWLALRGPGHDR